MDFRNGFVRLCYNSNMVSIIEQGCNWQGYVQKIDQCSDNWINLYEDNTILLLSLDKSMENN